MARIWVDNELRIRDVLTSVNELIVGTMMSLFPFTTSVGWLIARSSEYRSPRGMRHSPMALDCASMASGDEGGSASLR